MNDIPVPMDTPEIKKAAHGNHRWNQVLAAVSVATFVVALALFGFRFTDSAKQSTAQSALDAIQATSARNDCKSEINSVYAGLGDQRDNLGWKALLASANGDYQELAALKAQLSAVTMDIDKLPTRADAISKGYEFAGVHHPPCPKVT